MRKYIKDISLPAKNKWLPLTSPTFSSPFLPLQPSPTFLIFFFLFLLSSPLPLFITSSSALPPPLVTSSTNDSTAKKNTKWNWFGQSWSQWPLSPLLHIQPWLSCRSPSNPAQRPLSSKVLFFFYFQCFLLFQKRHVWPVLFETSDQSLFASAFLVPEYISAYWSVHLFFIIK